MPLQLAIQRNQNRNTILRTPPEINAAIYFFGRIRSGKSTSLKTLLEKYRDIRDYKIIDIGGDERAENLFWAIPSNKIKYWKILEKYLGEFNEKGPKQYKVNLLYPFFSSKLPKQLPYNPPYVKSKLFTIPYKNIDIEQISLVVNRIGESGKYLWRNLLEKLGKNDNSVMLNHKAKLIPEIARQSIYRNFIEPLTKELLLQNEKCYLNLNVKEELKDKKTISVLCLDLIPEIYHVFIIDYILNETKKLIKEGELGRKPKLLFGFREVSKYFRATTLSVVEDRFKKFRLRLSDHVRYARRGMHFFFDTQDFKECKGLIDGQQDLTFLGRIGDSESNREMLIQPLLRDKRMTKHQAEQLKYSEAGEMVIVTSGIRNVQVVYITLPRTMFWEEDSGNFYKNVWKDYIDKWENIEDVKKELKEKGIKTLMEIKERIRLKNVVMSLRDSVKKSNIIKKRKGEKVEEVVIKKEEKNTKIVGDYDSMGDV